MSASPHWLLSLPLRPDLDPAVLRLLAEHSAGRPLTDDVVAGHHPAVVHALADPDRLVLLRPGAVRDSWRLTVDSTFHDDEFAAGGVVFWLWLWTLLDPSTSRRTVLGTYAWYQRNDRETVLVWADADGVHEGDRVLGWDEVRDGYAEVLAADWPAPGAG